MAKEHGFKFLLDYHYSDTWADPAKQFIPKAWEGLSHETLVDSVYKYTRQTMIAFRNAGVFPDMVQVGNEISNGMLWPNGKLPDNWDNLAELIQAGINGVHASCGNNPCPQIMIHIDKGGDKEFTKYWFDKLLSMEWILMLWDNRITRGGTARFSICAKHLTSWPALTKKK